MTCPCESQFWDIWTDAWEMWKPEVIKWQQTASSGELCTCTRLQFPHSLQQSFLPVEAHWRVVVAKWHFLRLQAWVFDKLQHAPLFVSHKRPTHVVPPVARALLQVAKPMARNISNHVRGVMSIVPWAEPRFANAVPTVEELQWQLTQAASAAKRTCVLEAMAWHRHVALPRKRPREPSLPPARTPASPLHESHEIHAGPFLEKAKRRAMVHAQTQAARLCLEEVAQALTRQTLPGSPSYWRTTTSNCAGKRISSARNKHRGGT